MARASLTTQQVVRTGLTPSYTAAVADGDIIDSGAVFLHVKNASGVSVTVTIETPVTLDGLALADQAVAVPAAGERMIGPFPARTFQQPADAAVGANRVLVNYSAVASVTRAVVKV